MVREPISKTWRYFNDETVNAILQPAEFLNMHDKQAYVLMYEKQEPTVETILAKLSQAVDKELSQSMSQIVINNAESQNCSDESVESSKQQPSKRLKKD